VKREALELFQVQLIAMKGLSSNEDLNEVISYFITQVDEEIEYEETLSKGESK
jgi:hypothetical protein